MNTLDYLTSAVLDCAHMAINNRLAYEDCLSLLSSYLGYLVWIQITHSCGTAADSLPTLGVYTMIEQTNCVNNMAIFFGGGFSQIYFLEFFFLYLPISMYNHWFFLYFFKMYFVKDFLIFNIHPWVSFFFILYCLDLLCRRVFFFLHCICMHSTLGFFFSFIT